jgi:transcriptional regulator with XRE-family HTH domain
LPHLGRRRAPGLRRQELAQISGIGVSWYTSLEQGRDIQVSKELLQRLVSALRLSPHDAAYLSSLADHPVLEIREPSGELLKVLQIALDGFTAGPAFVTDEAFDVIAFNQLGNFIYGFDNYDGPHAANIAWRLFIDPYRRGIFVAWREWAAQCVGLLRAQCAMHPATQN